MKILYFICGLIGCIGLMLTGIISDDIALQSFCICGLMSCIGLALIGILSDNTILRFFCICGLIGCIGLILIGIISDNIALRSFCNSIKFILFGTCVIGYIDLLIDRIKKYNDKKNALDINEAIKHAEELAKGNTGIQCGKKHAYPAEWLRELVEIKKHI